MEDWRIVDGAAECQSLGGNRSVHSLTHQITNPAGRFAMSVRVTRVEARGKDGGGGFRIGIRSEINEYRSNCFASKGWNAGIRENELILGAKSVAVDGAALAVGGVELRLSGVPDGDQVVLTLEARSPATGASLGEADA